jgi:hypothetical protein
MYLYVWTEYTAGRYLFLRSSRVLFLTQEITWISVLKRFRSYIFSATKNERSRSILLCKSMQTRNIQPSGLLYQGLSCDVHTARNGLTAAH